MSSGRFGLPKACFNDDWPSEEPRYPEETSYVKALIVDDDQTARLLLRRALAREFAWTIVEAADGDEALVVLGMHDVGVVFLDLRMPGLSGFDTVRKLRLMPEYTNLPIIVTTADDRAATVQEAIGLGVTDYLVKPIDADGMRNRISRAIARHRRKAS